MSAQTEIVAKWDASPALLIQIPSDKVYLGILPEDTELPYAVLQWAEATYEWTSCFRIESFPFSVTIFDTDSDNVLSIGELVDDAYEFQPVADATIECRPVGKQQVAEPVMVTPGEVIFSYTLRYTLISQREA